ncbi:hypothetical protein [Robertmurraya kyonggiensis]|uniref:Uncharacterized protein n=1 Tax=Robertmurraya kyonggiensis TaxID=1037680 RepID=A0A4U1D8R6_9BACI|nr:hypothetical protein [Robertmurraya kyonggiensis]TKC18478.1 hypothetical protein FA727_02700 [Robertmurraya kyonggiensis]
MKGTAILFQNEQIVTIMENVEQSVLEELLAEHCGCTLNKKNADLGFVAPVIWHEEEIDWDYGY